MEKEIITKEEMIEIKGESYKRVTKDIPVLTEEEYRTKLANLEAEQNIAISSRDFQDSEVKRISGEIQELSDWYNEQ